MHGCIVCFTALFALLPCLPSSDWGFGGCNSNADPPDILNMGDETGPWGAAPRLSLPTSLFLIQLRDLLWTLLLYAKDCSAPTRRSCSIGS